MSKAQEAEGGTVEATRETVEPPSCPFAVLTFLLTYVKIHLITYLQGENMDNRITFIIDTKTKRKLKAFLARRGLTITKVMLYCVYAILNGTTDLSSMWLEGELPDDF